MNDIKHIRMGPPGPGDVEIPDEDLKFLILAIWRGLVINENFPVIVNEVIDNYDLDGNIESFTIITRSGLRFTTRVDFEEEDG